MKKILLIIISIITISITISVFMILQQKKLPDFNLIDIDGNKHTKSMYENNYLIVNYWATWCKPCLEEIPILNTINKEYKNVKILGFNHEHTGYEKIKEFQEKLKINYAIFPNVAENNFDEFGKITVLPTTHIYNKEDVLIEKIIGIVDEKKLKNIFSNNK